MVKYEKMVECNKEKKNINQAKAIAAIDEMLKDNRAVNVATLVKMTNLSRAYFYNNETVHRKLVKAKKSQNGIYNDNSIEKIEMKSYIQYIKFLEMQNKKLHLIVDGLKNEIERLKDNKQD